MKRVKLILFIGLILISLSIISAAISGVNFNTPVVGENISGNNYLINWTNTNGYPGLYLQYAIGGCNGVWVNLTGPIGNPNTTAYSWDTTGLEGVYCLRMFDNVLNITESGNITIDNTNPIANLSAGEPYLCNEGGNVTLNASFSTDNLTGIMNYEWELDGDNLYDDGIGVTINYVCSNGPAIRTVGVKVRDYANNTNAISSSVNISNVAPTCNGITAPSDAAVGEPVTFTQNVSDSMADILNYNWNFADGGTNNSNPTTHVFNSAGTYNVTVNVSDGTDNCISSHLINIISTRILPEQDVMALQNLDANFSPSQGSVANSFATNLTGGVVCTKRIVEPSPLTVNANGNDCVVTWSNAENKYNGKHLMVVRVDNGTNSEYYSFNTTVYSWKINLNQGWNLISIPVIPKNTSIQSVLFNQLYDSLPGGYEYVVWSYQYDGTQNNWLKSRRTGYGDLDYIEPGHGYWINMSSADILYGFGDKFIVAQTPPSKTITNGWNLIGHYGLLTVSENDALRSLRLGTTQYYSYVGTNSSGNFYPGEAYWIAATFLPDKEAPYTPSNDSYNFN